MISPKILLFFSLLLVYQGISQTACNCTLKGKVISKESGEVILGSYVYLKGQKTKAQTDEKGNFKLEKICPGTYLLVCEMSSFNKVETSITLKDHDDLTENLSLETHEEHLMEVLVTGKKTEITSQLKGELSAEERSQRNGLSLGEMLKGISGVQSLQTGSSISKPIIHGMHSSRVIILNQGVRQEGQQWGSEHAPEVDPFVSKNIQVIKGPAGLRYGGDAIGGIILLEPNSLPDTSGILGEAQTIFFTNGRQFVTSGMLEGGFKNANGWGWRVQGTLKNGGNIKTANYNLANTGVEEQNFSTALGYKNQKFGTDLFISRFHSVIGIYSGSHIGNINDLKAAIASERPFEIYTPTNFIREIERPNQDITHSLAKFKAYVNLTNKTIRMNVAYQDNERLEFDVMRLGKNINTLSFNLGTLSSEILIDESNSSKLWKGQFGLTYLIQGNLTSGNRINLPTLTSSLLPNYYLSNLGIFALERYVNQKMEIDMGLRLDTKDIEIHRPIQNYSTNIKRDLTNYIGLSGSMGLKYHWTQNFENHLIFARAFRAPSPNELFSNGVHHGAGAYEIGDPLLKGETAYNISLNSLYRTEKLELEIGLYTNTIHHFIYLKPLMEKGEPAFITTVRGSFPAFTYEQIDASFKGIDGQVSYSISESWSLQQKTSIVRAYDELNNSYLVNIPPDRFEYLIRYQFKKHKQYVSWGITQISMQKRVEVNADFLPPPKGYILGQVHWGISINKFDFGVSVTNAFNQAYRDYLNRFRYFADDQGQNISFRATYRFS
ncbi:MAG: TonB-dependent receptor [Cytophagales bacterium]|nr:TonB-dependent receptor [Cytophagales bacterium]